MMSSSSILSHGIPTSANSLDFHGRNLLQRTLKSVRSPCSDLTRLLVANILTSCLDRLTELNNQRIQLWFAVFAPLTDRFFYSTFGNSCHACLWRFKNHEKSEKSEKSEKHLFASVPTGTHQFVYDTGS